MWLVEFTTDTDSPCLAEVVEDLVLSRQTPTAAARYWLIIYFELHSMLPVVPGIEAKSVPTTACQSMDVNVYQPTVNSAKLA